MILMLRCEWFVFYGGILVLAVVGLTTQRLHYHYYAIIDNLFRDMGLFHILARYSQI
jgi:hypothetical protein